MPDEVLRPQSGFSGPHARVEPFNTIVQIDPFPAWRFEKVKRLASALHGKVFLCRDRQSGNSEVAIKRIDSVKVMNHAPLLLEDPRGEISVSTYLMSHPHPNVVRTLGVFQDESRTYLVNEYIAGAELYEAVTVRRDQLLNEAEARYIMHSLLLAVDHLHSLNIAHRDISMENIMIEGSTGNIKLIDYGQTVPIQSAAGVTLKYRGKAGKPYYRAPEMYGNKDYLPAPCDCFAAGVVLFILVFGVPPWQAAEPADSRWEFVKAHGLTSLLRSWGKLEFCSKQTLEFIELLLQSDPRKRPNTKQLLTDVWLQGPKQPWLAKI